MNLDIPSKKRSKFSAILALFFGILVFNVFVGYMMHYSIIAASCMTKTQINADSRCLYIIGNRIYEKGSRNSPHHGHPCGSDVTAVVPGSHQDGRLLPSYIADLCASVTDTPTPTPPTGSGATTFSITTLLHGLGSGGDNPNPSGAGNTNPSHPQRPVTVTVFDGTNTKVGTGQGTVTYNSSGGNFTGSVVVGGLSAGKDLISIKVDGFLAKQVPGIITISPGTTITLPSVTLVNGDINNDGQIDLLDYNALISCYGSKQTSTSCTNATAADLNDDGLVNGGDYNLFLRELSVQKGS